ncbi:MAG: GSU2403 family nucleotidyltransferase fold protein [Actinomycetota bacterium]|nr:GSU2403 family nucleotidyltransferase fold protein [Actinomycetota bacterium]
MTDAAPEYVAARTVLLDVLEALGSQREAVIVVGAQAIYMHTEDGGITGYAPYTTDADLALAPSRLAAEPLIEKLLKDANFEQKSDPGIWWKTIDIDGTPADIEVDIMVPVHFARTGGRRSARLPPHDKMIARKAIGLEGSILDHDLMEVVALDRTDSRQFTVRVAGPAALIVAKVYKLRDRLAEGRLDRIADKDAADVYRLMLAVPLREFLRRLRPVMDHETAGPVCREAIELMEQLFGSRSADGVRMARDALRIAVPPERVIDVCTRFTRQLREATVDG